MSICVAHASQTWPVLLSGRSDERFARVDWRATSDGAVLLEGASGWLDTSISQQVRAGDHDIVVMAVHDLDADHDLRPLLFHSSQFRRPSAAACARLATSLRNSW